MGGIRLFHSTPVFKIIAARSALTILRLSFGTKLRMLLMRLKWQWRFLGETLEPNSVVKNDIEFILMQRKPGGYRAPSGTEGSKCDFR